MEYVSHVLNIKSDALDLINETFRVNKNNWKSKVITELPIQIQDIYALLICRFTPVTEESPPFDFVWKAILLALIDIVKTCDNNEDKDILLRITDLVEEALQYHR